MMAKKGSDINLAYKYNDKGINRHTVWHYLSNVTGREAGIDHNHDVCDGGFYLFPISVKDFSHGEGCDTIYYPNLKTAKTVIRRYLNGEIGSIPTGRDAGVCDGCRGFEHKCHSFKIHMQEGNPAKVSLGGGN